MKNIFLKMTIINFAQIDKLYFFFSFFISIIALNLLLPFLKRKIMDKPNIRSSHENPIPSGGGISFVSIGTFFSILSGFWEPLILLPLSIVGYLDDLKNLSSRIRYVFQVGTSLLIISVLNIQNLDIYLLNSKITEIICLTILIVFITGLINLVNFMDGIDGLVAGCMFINLSTISFFEKLPLIGYSGAILGFLLLNWSPAKVFMGDVGSTFLGGLFALCILKSLSIEFIIGMLLINTPLLADSTLCVIRRFLTKQNIFKPHRNHLYQRLYQAGWSHSKVSIFYIGSTAMLSLLFALSNIYYLILGSILIFILGIVLDLNFAEKFKVES